jgi:uncharacterized protein GlcG (DUF336 family)
MTDLTLDAARRIIDGALACRKEKGYLPLAVAVYDARGALKAFGAEEGTSLKRAEMAQGKALAALAVGMGSRTLGKMAIDRPHFINALQSLTPHFVPVPGGVLIRDAAGGLMGAVGISGDVSDNDETAALAGIAAAGLKGDPGAS